jgi:beta-glucosidase
VRVQSSKLLKCSSNFKVNEVYSCESSVLGEILRRELGFKGFVVTDWAANAAAKLAVAAGVDMAMPGDLGALGAAGYEIQFNDTHTMLDEMVLHIIASWYKMRQDEDYPDIDYSVDGQDDHKTLIREIAAEGAVLIKNTGVLPLSSLTSLGIFGSDAGPNPAGLNSCGEYNTCNRGTLAVGWGSGAGKFVYLSIAHFETR